MIQEESAALDLQLETHRDALDTATVAPGSPKTLSGVIS
jgi:hypothetical protein